MKTIKYIFDEISAEPGTNNKMEILTGHVKNDSTGLLQRVLYLANSPRIKFHIKQIPSYTTSGSNIILKDAIEQLIFLSNRTLTGHDGIEHLKKVLESVSSSDAYIIERIIEKDCKLGMGTTNINKVYEKNIGKEIIESTPYMGAKSFKRELAEAIFKDPKNKGYAYSQIKMDGRYLNAIISGGTVKLESRSGELTRVEGAKFVEELKQFQDCVLNGELTIDGVPRLTSNGIIASLISIGEKKAAGENVTTEIKKFEKEKKITYQKALDSIRLTVWDTITEDEYLKCISTVPYHDRLVNLSKILKPTKPTMVSFIKTKKVYAYEQAMEHFQELLLDGQEGTILKASMGTWEDNKPNWQVKMKLEMNIDLKIIGFKYGTGKNANVISTIDCESSDGLLKASPTSMTEDKMKWVTANQATLLGTILEVKCNGISNDSLGNYSLFYPVVKHFRDDKTTCDDLQSIKDIEAAAKSLPKTMKPIITSLTDIKLD